jgi:hypothetical protein
MFIPNMTVNRTPGPSGSLGGVSQFAELIPSTKQMAFWYFFNFNNRQHLLTKNRIYSALLANTNKNSNRNLEIW